MRLRQSDFDQAARYVRSACETMERTAAAKTRGLRATILADSLMRLSPEHRFRLDVDAEVLTLRAAAQQAKEFGQADAATDLLKAVAVLRDTHR